MSKPLTYTLPWLAVLLLVSRALAGCAHGRMVVPKDIAAVSDEFVAVGRVSASGVLIDESFTLGPYGIQKIRHGVNWTLSSRPHSAVHIEADGYAYQVQWNGVTVSGTCATNADPEARLLFEEDINPSAHRLHCVCRASDHAEPARLSVATDYRPEDLGEIQTSSGRYRLRSIFDREGPFSSVLSPSGYRVDGDTPRGAVEVVMPGRAWFARDLSERDRTDIACLYAGLMLYQP
jgi:hypothetical protein